MYPGLLVRSDSALLNGETRSLQPARSRVFVLFSLFLPGGWRSLIAPLGLKTASPSTTTGRKTKTKERIEKEERRGAEARRRSFGIFSEKNKERKKRQEVSGEFEEFSPSKDPTPSPTQRRSSPRAQPQVYPSLDRFPFVTATEKCSALKQKNGSLFSKEELNYLGKCPRSVSSQESHQLHSFHSPYRLEMPEEKFLAPEISLYKKPGWLDSEGMASHINWARRPRQIGQGVPDKLGKASQANWAWRPTVNGQGVPGKQGMMSPLGVQKTSPYLGTVWSGHSFPTGTQSVWEDRLWQPQTGSRTPANGNSIHGMSPSWATFSFSAQAKLQMRCQQDNVQGGPSAPFFERLQQRLPWWQVNTQDPSVLSLISHGVAATYALPSSLSLHPCFRNQEETNLAWETIKEYLDVGAIKEIPLQQAKHLIPWFVIKKGEKLRLITNCKELNNYLEPKPFRLENWPEIVPYLRKGMWEAK